jgi:hypothetical protein
MIRKLKDKNHSCLLKRNFEHDKKIEEKNSAENFARTLKNQMPNNDPCKMRACC